MGDFNEVRRVEERWGSSFNMGGARVFNNFIANAGLIDLQLEGFNFTWAHPLATKMSKLDHFLVSNGIISSFPCVSAVCLDKHLSDHRPILLREVYSDFGAIPFRFYQSWLSIQGFEQLVSHTWNTTCLNDSNEMIRFKKKLQILKKEIRVFVADQKKNKEGRVKDIKAKLSDIDKKLDQGGVNDDILAARMECMNFLFESKAAETRDFMQKAKIKWAVEGDENSKFFHGMVNPKRANLAVKGIMIDGVWVDDPRKVVGSDFCMVVEWFFDNASFPIGCNSSFIALIPKSLDPKVVGDFRPISLIGCIYKVITKILQSRLSLYISDLISDVQTAFLPNRQILDGPFIINELLARCRHKKQQAMVFKVDFAKAYDSIRWDSLDDVLCSFGFGSKWRSWISGCLSSRLSINIKKSHLLGVGVPSHFVNEAADMLGSSVMKVPFKYLGITVGGNTSLVKTWDETINKLKLRLSKWKLKTLSLGGVLRFSNRFLDLLYVQHVLVSRALLLKWVWRFLSRDNSLWFRIIHAIHGSQDQGLSAAFPSNWSSIVKEVKALFTQGIDIISHCKIKVGNGRSMSFWKDLWIGDIRLCHKFPCLFTLDVSKEGTVTSMLSAPLSSFFRRDVRGGAEAEQLSQCLNIIGSVVLSNSDDRFVWDLNGDGEFRVKDIRKLLDDSFLPKDESPTRWVKSISIKINIFAWKVSLDRIPTRQNLVQRGVSVPSLSCPNCNNGQEHLGIHGTMNTMAWLIMSNQGL
ncbi:RNA-directed DNA polymerase, eukaryota [Tanacetum coccineum]